MAGKAAEERRRRLKEIFDRMEGTIKFDGTACDLLRELRKRNFNMSI